MTAQGKDTISIEEARQLVHSLPERLHRFTSGEPEPANHLGAMTLASIAVGVALSVAVFSSRFSSATRMIAGMGAALSAGTAAILGISSYTAKQSNATSQHQL